MYDLEGMSQRDIIRRGISFCVQVRCLRVRETRPQVKMTHKRFVQVSNLIRMVTECNIFM